MAHKLSIIAFMGLDMILSGCATVPAVSDYCRAFTPIYVNKADVLSDETAKQILAADETWAKLCGTTH